MIQSVTNLNQSFEEPADGYYLFNGNIYKKIGEISLYIDNNTYENISMLNTKYRIIFVKTSLITAVDLKDNKDFIESTFFDSEGFPSRVPAISSSGLSLPLLTPVKLKGFDFWFCIASSFMLYIDNNTEILCYVPETSLLDCFGKLYNLSVACPASLITEYKTGELFPYWFFFNIYSSFGLPFKKDHFLKVLADKKDFLSFEEFKSYDEEYYSLYSWADYFE
ncbi:hypothetical protein BB381_00300 [Campylobacter pinnipediorum subsp. caledonicus]|uniref:hypothetical protein n=1 Tax=Campylobacter pinnipediorum TaxID=1965231 RepID=UPI000994AA4D|nr:hypothetical protein [Campylobacter pinnipediorum]AQW85531.1 hypothetical protein CPIN18020_0287 [Campylobacter pinnipediorum subsp. caledonicus]OPA72028.1 hypothetical protein BB381_00300 [Campylobacter pinnipediorum subsp. caledonicus]